MKNSLCLILIVWSSFLFAQEELERTDMTLEKMEQIFQEEAQELDGERGIWQMFYGNRILFVLTDTSHNRMRIFTPIGAEEDLEVGQEKILLEANFTELLFGLQSEEPVVEENDQKRINQKPKKENE